MKSNTAENIKEEPISSPEQQNDTQGTSADKEKKDHLKLVTNEENDDNKIDQIPDKEHELNKPENKQASENKVEKEKIEIHTVADFVSSLEHRADICEDEALKNKLTLQAAKIRIALGAAGLDLHQVKVSKTSENVLGLYDKQTGKIEMNLDMLEDFKTEKGEIEDIGMQQLMHKVGYLDDSAAAKASGQNRYYQLEERKFTQTFYKIGLEKALKLYDKNNPGKLFDKYGRLGVESRMSKKDLKKYKGDNVLSKIRVNIECSHIEETIVSKFASTVPELMKKLGGYDIKKHIKLFITDYAKKSAKD